jgi:hypothetical protein
MAGAKSRNVGVDTERRVAGYFRQRGYSGAERAVRTGWRTPLRAVADPGDVMGVPGWCVQVKSLRPDPDMERAVPRWLAETEEQRRTAGAVVGVLVVRRWGIPDAGRWWAFLDAATLFALESGQLGNPAYLGAGDPLLPVRLELRHLVDLMERWGWSPAAQPVSR